MACPHKKTKTIDKKEVYLCGVQICSCEYKGTEKYYLDDRIYKNCKEKGW